MDVKARHYAQVPAVKPAMLRVGQGRLLTLALESNFRRRPTLQTKSP